MKKAISVLLTAAMLISILSVGTSATNVIEGSVSTEIISPENPAHPYLPEPGPNEPNWGSGYNSTHQFITGNAINLIRNAVSSYPLSSYTTTLKTQSDWPDSSDESKSRGENDAGLFLGHFYDPTTGKTWDGSTSPNAKIRLTNNYQRAVSAYKAGNKANAMSSSTFAAAASNTLPKAQRNCAAVIYKFLVDVGAVS